jgi:hypothetical protein
MDWTGIRKAFILCIRKGGSPGKGGLPAHDLREIAIEYDENLIQDIYKKWSYVWECVQSETPPEVK